jgi:transposase
MKLFPNNLLFYLTLFLYHDIKVVMKMRVQYIQRPHKNKVYSYPFIVSSYRDKKGIPRTKVVQNLSHLPAHVVQAIDLALRSEGEVDSVPVDTVQYLDSLPFGDIWAVWCVMKDLGILEALEQLSENHQVPIVASIIDRIINPKPYSKRALWDAFENSALKQLLGVDERISLSVWYEALDALYAHQMEIQKQLFVGSSERLYLYDITSTYFEGKCCPLADWGVDRDHKKGKLIMVIGLLTNEEGRPMAVKVFQGNTSDQTTLIAQIKELREAFGIEEMIFVGDRGMITSKRISELESGEFPGVKYITAIKRKEMMSLVADPAHPIQLGLFDHQNLVEVTDEGRRYILCHNPLRKDEDEQTRLKLLDKTQSKLSEIENSVKSGRLKKEDKIARRLYRWLNKWNMERFFSVEYGEGHFRFSRNEEEIERYSVLDGCYVIVSNLDANEMDTDSVHRKYKDLKYVENAFRSMKVSDLCVRPVRHWSETRVRGHVFMCMLAYLVLWEVNRRLSPLLQRDPETRECDGKSLREIWDALKRITIGWLNVGSEKVKQISRINKHQRDILKLLRAPLGRKQAASILN